MYVTIQVGELLPRLSILTASGGGLFLLHFPGGYPRLTLSAILPYEARTFLTLLPFGMIKRDHPAKLPSYYNTRRPFCQQDKILTKKKKDRKAVKIQGRRRCP